MFGSLHIQVPHLPTEQLKNYMFGSMHAEISKYVVFQLVGEWELRYAWTQTPTSTVKPR
jgi:hypothetical protein